MRKTAGIAGLVAVLLGSLTACGEEAGMIHSCDSYYSDLGGVDDVDYETSSAMEMQSDVYRVDLRDSSYATLATCRVRSDGEYYHVSSGPAF